MRIVVDLNRFPSDRTKQIIILLWPELLSSSIICNFHRLSTSVHISNSVFVVFYKDQTSIFHLSSIVIYITPFWRFSINMNHRFYQMLFKFNATFIYNMLLTMFSMTSVHTIKTCYNIFITSRYRQNKGFWFRKYTCFSVLLNSLSIFITRI